MRRAPDLSENDFHVLAVACEALRLYFEALPTATAEQKWAWQTVYDLRVFCHNRLNDNHRVAALANEIIHSVFFKEQPLALETVAFTRKRIRKEKKLWK